MVNKHSVYIGISPSKDSLRIGELRTHLYTYAFGRRNNLPVYIKCDDTNPDSRSQYQIETLIDEMKIFGIEFTESELTYWNNSIIYQSKNTKIYERSLKILNNLGVLSEYNELISLDFIKATNLIGNFDDFGGDILRRSIKFDLKNTGYKYIPLYSLSEKRFFFHLPCVVDEHLMNTSISINGEDKIALMPIHNTIRSLLNFEMIKYLHLPLLLMPDSSMRVKGEKYSVKFFLKQYSVDRLTNYLLKSGYRSYNDKTTNLNDFIVNFNFESINKKSGQFDVDKI